MTLLKKLKFWHYRNINDGLPSSEEVSSLGAWNDLCEMIKKSKKEDLGGVKFRPVFRRYVEMAAHYSLGESLEEIAKEHNVTRERVRQCIMKYYREKRKLYEKNF